MGLLARTIAVIDEDARVLELLQNLLASCGIRRRRTHLPNFFSRGITDVEMRRMSGFRTPSACQKHEDLLLLTKPSGICLVASRNREVLLTKPGTAQQTIQRHSQRRWRVLDGSRRTLRNLGPNQREDRPYLSRRCTQQGRASVCSFDVRSARP